MYAVEPNAVLLFCHLMLGWGSLHLLSRLRQSQFYELHPMVFLPNRIMRNNLSKENQLINKFTLKDFLKRYEHSYNLFENLVDVLITCALGLQHPFFFVDSYSLNMCAYCMIN
jgi:hypothetical protein